MTAAKERLEKGGGAAEEGSQTFWRRHQADLILALLFLYVILLGIGTIAELFQIKSILSWPIYR
jgi:hypothetical protein